MKINKMFLNRKNSSSYLIICLLLGLVPFALASPNVGRPSEIPIFTKAKVEQMLDSLSEGRNLLSLKIRYFGGHTNSPFPATNGFELLQVMLQKQEMGNLKWFQLESLKGYAAFHVPGVSVIEGYDAYGLLFDKEVKADSPQAQRVVRASVRDFVNVVCHMNATFGSKHLSSDSLVRHLLLKAWMAWNRLPPSTSKRENSPDWGRAVEAINAQNEFGIIIEKTLGDATNTLDFSTLKLAVVVLQDKDPERAVELLKTAQTKLQPDDRYNQKWLYETWTQLITDNDDTGRAVARRYDKNTLERLVEMRRDQISYTGTGYAKLLQLYWQLEQYEKANELIMVVKGPGIRASQKIDVAKVLLQPFHRRDAGAAKPQFSKETISQLQEQGVALLQGYLMSLQENPPESPFEKGDLRKHASSERETLGIRARYELGRYYMKQDQVTEALQALDIGDLKPTSRHTETAMYYKQILQMKADLTEKLKGVEGVK